MFRPTIDVVVQHADVVANNKYYSELGVTVKKKLVRYTRAITDFVQLLYQLRETVLHSK